MTALARPYLAALAARFQLTLQYRAAALAGFATQLWWGALKIMVFAAFYSSAAAAGAPINLAQTITYTWIGQAFLAMQPWATDPEVALAVRTGAVGYDRLRPVDTYGFWYARSTAWLIARAAPRATLMVLFAGLLLPAAGLGEWSWRAPAGLVAGLAFVASMALAALLCGAIIMLLNIIVAATLNERGVNTLALPTVVVFSGNIVPLALFPDAAQPWLIAQPLAGVLDIPCRIYFGALTGEGILLGLGLQAFWTAVLVLGGRAWLDRVMRRLQVQGG